MSIVAYGLGLLENGSIVVAGLGRSQPATGETNIYVSIPVATALATISVPTLLTSNSISGVVATATALFIAPALSFDTSVDLLSPPGTAESVFVSPLVDIYERQFSAFVYYVRDNCFIVDDILSVDVTRTSEVSVLSPKSMSGLNVNFLPDETVSRLSANVYVFTSSGFVSSNTFQIPTNLSTSSATLKDRESISTINGTINTKALSQSSINLRDRESTSSISVRTSEAIPRNPKSTVVISKEV